MCTVIYRHRRWDERGLIESQKRFLRFRVDSVGWFYVVLHPKRRVGWWDLLHRRHEKWEGKDTKFHFSVRINRWLLSILNQKDWQCHHCSRSRLFLALLVGFYRWRFDVFFWKKMFQGCLKGLSNSKLQLRHCCRYWRVCCREGKACHWCILNGSDCVRKVLVCMFVIPVMYFWWRFLHFCCQLLHSVLHWW